MEQLLQTLRLQLVLMKSNMVNQLEQEYVNHMQKLLEQKVVITQSIHKAFDRRLKHLETMIHEQQHKSNFDALLQCLSQQVRNQNNTQNDTKQQTATHVSPNDIKTNQDDVDSYIFDSDENAEYKTQHQSMTDMTMVKKGNNRFNCLICGKHFTLKHHLTSHMRVHQQEKPFQCKYCDKSFKWKHNLKTHLKMHARQKPFQCGYCCKRFTHKKRVIRHQKKRHSNE
eukprot:269492_1